MRVIQVLPELNYGDAIGNNAIAIDKIINDAGIETELYADRINTRVTSERIKQFSELSILNKNDILLYHFATYFGKNLRSFGGRLIFQYHNITPSHYFEQYDSGAVYGCELGQQELKSYNDAPVLCWADSVYNKQELIKNGYACPIHVIPILVPFEDYEKPADVRTLEKYNDEYVNFLFVGRVVPNKAIEDVIRIFAWYQLHINPACRLFIVGNMNMDSYVNRLRRYISALKVKNVIFLGHINFSEVLAYYQIADIFLCMSRHEGFCVPLLEAMYFQIPIIARDTSAIPYTLGGAGVMVEDNEPIMNALLANEILINKTFRQTIITGQNNRLKEFSQEKVSQMILHELEQLMQ